MMKKEGVKAMKNTVEAVALFVLICLAFTFAAGCGDASSTGMGKDGSDSIPDTEEEAISPYADELPALDYDGDTVNITSWDYADVVGELYSEAIDGEIVNDAVFNRNLDVEKRLNIDMNVILIKNTEGQYTVPKAVYAAVASGDSSYDIMSAPTYSSAYIATNDIFVDLNSLDYLDLSKNYWAQGFNSTMSVGKAQYICSGTPSISLYRYMYVLVYNKVMFEEYNLGDPIELVRSGKWTVEQVIGLSSAVYTDVNGDGKRDYNDIYGFACGARTSSDTFWVNFGVDMFVKDENNFYLYQPESERLSDSVDAVLKLYYGSGGSYIVPHGEDGVRDTKIQTLFAESRAAMAVSHLYGIEHNMRNMEDEFTILPMPMLNEEQGEYKTYTQVELTAYAVTKTVEAERLGMMGAFLEALASESYKTVYNAYYETALSYKYLQNAESVEMLSLVYETTYMDPSIIYYNETGGMLGSLREMMRDDKNTVASNLASIETAVTAGVQTMNDAYKAIQN